MVRGVPDPLHRIIPAASGGRDTGETGGVTTDTDPPRLTITDPAVMRALAHPARLAIIEHLAGGATGTATELAAVCGLSPSATSYHLRALARYGLVREAPGRGDARERVWSRSDHRGLRVDLDPTRDAESRAAERSLVTVVLDRDDALVRRWIDRAYGEPAEWRDAATLSSALVLLTAEELAALNQAVSDLLEPYLAGRRADPPPGARRVRVVVRSFPTD